MQGDSLSPQADGFPVGHHESITARQEPRPPKTAHSDEEHWQSQWHPEAIPYTEDRQRIRRLGEVVFPVRNRAPLTEKKASPYRQAT